MIMELQLRLAPPSSSMTKKVVGSGQVINKAVLQLGLCHPPNWFSSESSSDDNNNNVRMAKKRCFDDASEDYYFDKKPQTLPLLLWDNQRKEDDDHRDSNDVNKNCSFAFNKIDEDEIVGWPPIKLPRKKLRYKNRYNIQTENKGRVENSCPDCRVRPSNFSMFVKVKMEGAAIARKIDLSLYHSLQTLKFTLLGMFGICQENSSGYKLIYQDGEGDWLLAEDVPWRSFMRSVQRLKLMRSSG